MWLLDTSTLVLREFIGTNIPEYAILSHTWGAAEEEVSFRDLRKDRIAAKGKAGYAKVTGCCLRAAYDGHQYVWIDTCCIDKRSSAELSEAINSMYKWYQNAQVCYVYLVDVPSSALDLRSKVHDDAFSKSRWFRRGWTLQELIAPDHVQFFAQDWNLIGTKGGSDQPASYRTPFFNDPFVLRLANITSIEPMVLYNPPSTHSTSLAQRMSWAARRYTTRGEDTAYALMGLFDVNMPILYGEGQQKAFKRLQLEIIKSSPDQSIFAWHSNRASSGLLAESPLDFANSGYVTLMDSQAMKPPTVLPHAMTNVGLSINLPLYSLSVPNEDFVLAGLRCWDEAGGACNRVVIRLRRIQRISLAESVLPFYRREQCNKVEVVKQEYLWRRREIYVLEEEQSNHIERIDLFAIVR